MDLGGRRGERNDLPLRVLPAAGLRLRSDAVAECICARTLWRNAYLLCPLQKQAAISGEQQELVLTIPIFEPLPPQ